MRHECRTAQPPPTYKPKDRSLRSWGTTADNVNIRECLERYASLRTPPKAMETPSLDAQAVHPQHTNHQRATSPPRDAGLS